MVLILINYDNSIVRLLVRYASLPYPTLPYPSGTLRERERCANGNAARMLSSRWRRGTPYLIN